MTSDNERYQIQRLREEQQKALAESQGKLSILEKYKEDYKTLSTRLTTLPDKTAHDVMIPFGSLAFMPGELIHTNEVMVLLGDNWFVERSTKQACEIITRRIKGIENTIEDLQKQRGLLEPRLDFTSAMQDVMEEKGDLIEIKEEYDEEKEKEWKEKHRKSLQRNRKEVKKQRQSEMERMDKEVTETQRSSGHGHGDAELWSRLDQLERQESEAQELDRLSDDHVSEKQSNDASSPSISTEESDESDDPVKPNMITFKHSKPPDSSDHSHNVHQDLVSTSSQNPPQTSAITSPSDIYRTFMQSSQQPRSILKQTKPGDDAQTEAKGKDRNVHFDHVQTQPKPDKIVAPPKVPAFTGQIQERIVSSSSNAEITQPSTSARMSKFKSRRMQSKQ